MPPTQTEQASSSSSSSSSSSKQYDAQLPLSNNETVQQQEINNNACIEQEDDEQKETVIVFDWDDTLLSSTFLASKGYRLDSNMSNCSADLLSALSALSVSVCAVLKLACTYGRVYIITNAETGWVELSAQKFLPDVLPLLQSLNIQILSARSTFESSFPDSPLKWKCSAFSSLLDPLLSQLAIHKNIMSFGDSHVEREAVRTVTYNHVNTLCKSVKFAERPTCEQLRRQIDLVINCMEYIHHHNNHLDLQLTVTVNEQSAEEKEREERMKCREQSSMPAHDDGCGTNTNTLKRSTTTSTFMDEDDEEIEEEKAGEVY